MSKQLGITCESLLNDCKDDFRKINKIIKKSGKASDEIPYLTRYALIKSHGTIEQCYKSIISDFCYPGASIQMKTFFDNNFKERAADLRYDRICRVLNNFDGNWKKSFKEGMARFTRNEKQIKTSISSLVVARNQFAHGLNPTITYDDIKKYFRDSERLIRCLNRSIK